jgi:4a-hydroxytetrahydrobiopterin dehydratase
MLIAHHLGRLRMSELHTIRCVGCEGGVPPLKKNEIAAYLAQTPGWEVSPDQTFIQRHYSFKNFYQTMAFVNAIAWIANQENHHPDLEVGFNYCVIKFTTHAISGLSKNDFICAAKINQL